MMVISSSSSNFFHAIFPVVPIFFLLLIILGTETKAANNALILEEMDRQIGPYAIEWPSAHSAEKFEDGTENSNNQNEWIPEWLRLKKRAWSTQLRFGKRAPAEPRRQWASQVRFGRK